MCAAKKVFRPGNHVTLDELTRIEENANRSVTPDAETILRLCAAFREAMQIRESALAIMERERLLKTEHELRVAAEDANRL